MRLVPLVLLSLSAGVSAADLNVPGDAATITGAIALASHGDTIHVVTKVKEMRESKSRRNAGLGVCEHIGYNQRDEEVAYCVRTAFMRKKSA